MKDLRLVCYGEQAYGSESERSEQEPLNQLKLRNTKPENWFLAVYLSKIFELFQNFSNTLLTECWRQDPRNRLDPDKIRDLLITHPTMITACLDSPMASVATDEDCVESSDVRSDRERTWRATPSPSLKRSRTITQLTQDQIKVLMPHGEDGATPTGAM